MIKSTYRWMFTAGVGLILLTQMLFAMPFRSAQGLPVEEVSSASSDPGGVHAGISAEDWEQILNQMGASYEQQAYLKASNPDFMDAFGYSVDIDGDTIVVGAYAEDGDGTGQENDDESFAGAAYVFVRSGGTWTQQAYLKASNAEANDRFGYSVAIDGDTIVVGAYAEDGDGSSESNNDAYDAGAVYVFVRSGTSWTQQAYLKSCNIDAEDNFGWSVAVDGDFIVVGAYGEDCDGTSKMNNDASMSGAAYVYVRSGDFWVYKSFLKASTIEAFDYFGYSVAIDGETIVVGAYGEDSDGTGESNNGAKGAGAAYVFDFDGVFWNQVAFLKADNTEDHDFFGDSVAIDGDTIVVGATGEDGDGTSPANNDASDAGAAYVFVRDGTTCTQQGYLKADNAGQDDCFGVSVDIVGDKIVAGAGFEASDGSGPGNDDAESAGAAYVFTCSGGVWTQQAYLKASNAETNDRFGYSVAIDGDTIVAGAFGEASDGTGEENNNLSFAGAAYVFKALCKAYLPFIMR